MSASRVSDEPRRIRQSRNTAPISRTIAPPPACSFCGKGPDQIQLVVGPDDIRICLECVHLCVEILESGPPAPSRVQEATLILEDGSRHVVATGLGEAASMLGSDDTRLVAFELVAGGRMAVRRQAVRQIHAEPDPALEPTPRPDWAGHVA